MVVISGVSSPYLQDMSWLTQVSPGLYIRGANFTVIVHGISGTTFDVAKWKSILPYMNRDLFDVEKDIESVNWIGNRPPQECSPPKSRSSIVIHFRNEKAAKESVRQHIIIDGEPKKTEWAQRPLNQCYRCQAFGYFASACKNDPKCRHCLGKHESKECIHCVLQRNQVRQRTDWVVLPLPGKVCKLQRKSLVDGFAMPSGNECGSGSE